MPDEPNTNLESAEPRNWGPEGDTSFVGAMDELPMEVDLGGGRNGHATDEELMRYAWSQIASRIAFGIDLTGLVAWAIESRPRTKKERMALFQLVELANEELSSWPCRREAMIAEARVQQETWRARIPKDYQDDEREAERLFSIEASAQQTMAEISRRELQFGRMFVRAEAARYFTAKMRAQQCLNRAATGLCPAAYMLFVNLKVEADIIKSIADDKAKGIPYRDYTKLLHDLAEGKYKDKDGATAVAAAGLKFLQIAITYAQFEQADQNPRLQWLQTVLTNLPQRTQQRRGYRRDREDRED